MSDDTITALQVLQVREWTQTLFSFRVNRPKGFRFTAGQFVSLGMNPAHLSHFFTQHTEGTTQTLPPSYSEADTIFRAYSIVSSEYDDFLEFFSVVIPDGAFTSRLQYLQVGDTLWLKKTPYGFLTLARYQQPPPQDLWLLATGTGIAPFLSMLKTLEVWETYQNIILVYSVRHASELAYHAEILALPQTYANNDDGTHRVNFQFITIVTRDEPKSDKNASTLNQRLPVLLANGKLEEQVGLRLDSRHSHVMLCGNPQMVEDTKEALKSLGLTMNRRGEGNIAVENYW